MRATLSTKIGDDREGQCSTEEDEGVVGGITANVKTCDVRAICKLCAAVGFLPIDVSERMIKWSQSLTCSLSTPAPVTA